MANSEIRRKAKENGVNLWRIADALGITDGNFSRKLRKELSEAEKEQIFKIIDDLKKQPIRKNNLMTGGKDSGSEYVIARYCDECGEPIFVGEKYYEITDIFICKNCIEEFAKIGEVNG